MERSFRSILVEHLLLRVRKFHRDARARSNLSLSRTIHLLLAIYPSLCILVKNIKRDVVQSVLDDSLKLHVPREGESRKEEIKQNADDERLSRGRFAYITVRNAFIIRVNSVAYD